MNIEESRLTIARIARTVREANARAGRENVSEDTIYATKKDDARMLLRLVNSDNIEIRHKAILTMRDLFPKSSWAIKQLIKDAIGNDSQAAVSAIDSLEYFRLPAKSVEMIIGIAPIRTDAKISNAIYKLTSTQIVCADQANNLAQNIIDSLPVCSANMICFLVDYSESIDPQLLKAIAEYFYQNVPFSDVSNKEFVELCRKVLHLDD